MKFAHSDAPELFDGMDGVIIFDREVDITIFISMGDGNVAFRDMVM